MPFCGGVVTLIEDVCEVLMRPARDNPTRELFRKGTVPAAGTVPGGPRRNPV